MEGFENSVFMASAEYMLKEGYAFDLISDKQSLQVKTANQLLSTGGVHYQTIILSDCKYIPVETMTKLVSLVRDGATVVFYKNRPLLVPGFLQLAQKTKVLDQLNREIRFISATVAGVQKAALGKGVFLTGDDLSQLLSFAKIRREALVDDSLLFVRRNYEDGHVYFISNNGSKKLNAWVPLSVKAVGVAQFDPMSERSGVSRSRKSASGVPEVFLQLGPGESCVLQTSAAAIKGKAFPYFSAKGTPELLAGEWEIKFTDGGPKLPATVRTTQLGSWTALPGDEVKSFSGTAQYSIAVKKPGFAPQVWLLDLGTVGESAEVLLNGNKLTTLIGPAYQLVVPHALLKADKLLQINVTNGMANRIADLDKRGVEWKKFYNTNFPSR